MANLDVLNDAFTLPIDIESSGLTEKTLKTKNTFVDKDIKIFVNTKVAEFGDAVPKEMNETSKGYFTEDSEKGIPVVTPAMIISVGEGGGFIDEGTEIEIQSETLYIKKGSLAGIGAASVDSDTIKMTKVESKPESGFYIKASTTDGTCIAEAGWVDENTALAEIDGDSYYILEEANLDNAKQEGVVYTEIEGPILVPGEGLYINEGYIGNTYIPLADLVPDDAAIKGQPGQDEDGKDILKNDLMYHTLSAYDKDSNLIIGTMRDSEFVLGDANIEKDGEIEAPELVTRKKNGATVSFATTAPSEGDYIEISIPAANNEVSITGTVTAVASKGYVAEDKEDTVNIDEKVALIYEATSQYIPIYNGLYK